MKLDHLAFNGIQSIEKNLQRNCHNMIVDSLVHSNCDIIIPYNQVAIGILRNIRIMIF